MPRLAVAAALGGAAACVLLPDRLRLDHRMPLVDAVAWRPQAAVATLGAAAALAAGRRTRPAAAVLGAVAVTAVGACAGRAFGSVADRVGAAPDDLSVLTFNVLNGRADAGELATLIEREAPHFVVLPEAGPDFRDKLMALVDVLGYRSCVAAGRGGRDVDSVTMLGSARADAAMRVATAMRIPHVEATGGVLGDRTLYAAHTIAPLGRWRTAAWRHDLDVLGGWTDAAAAPIVAGDLNATLDHRPLRAALGGCRSAATGTGRGLLGTYPARLPRWAGIQIDHVLVPAAAVTTRFQIVEIAGSDHRGVLAAVRLPPLPAA